MFCFFSYVLSLGGICWCCYWYVFFIKKETLYLHISVTIPLVWESKEGDYESSGRCRVQGRGHVSENCVLVSTNVEKVHHISLYDHIRKTLRDSVHCLLEDIGSTSLSYEPGKWGTSSWLTAPRKFKHKRGVPFSTMYISPILSTAPYSKENQKHDKEKNWTQQYLHH
jgi:hypothetical protein